MKNIIPFEKTHYGYEEAKREYESPEIEIIEISLGQSFLNFTGSGDGTESFDMGGDYW